MIGKSVSHYQILEELGAGGMGVVYKAMDMRLERPVALKFLPPELTRNDEAKQRFIQEAKTASHLQHNNICTVHEIDKTSEGQLFISMDCYDGETLVEKMRGGALPLEQAVDIAAQIASGLAKAHGAGIVHRDIKPANIMVTSDGVVKILDFGIAKLTGESKLTKTGSTLGTIAYMSPEQARGDTVDHRTDIWSLGVLLFEMISGCRPFKGDFEQAVIYSILNEDPAPFEVGDSPAGKTVMQAIARALSKDPGDRYQTIDEFKSALESESTEFTAHSAQTGRTPAGSRFKNRLFFPAALVLIIAALILVLKPILSDQVLISEPKPIAVISFENQTGDETYDYLQKAIPNLLTTSLEQSKYLRVITWERMNDLIKQMGLQDVDIIDSDLGFELCRMEDIAIIVCGSFTKAGDVFATDVKVLNANNKSLIKSASCKGSGIESILEKQIDELSKEISRSIGLSDQNIASTHPRIAEVTTSSIDAYNYFLRGREDYEKFYYGDALQFLKKALQVDSTFAVAYLYQAMAYDKLGDARLRNRSYAKAMACSEKTSYKERLYIEAEYALTIEKNPEKRIQIYEQIAEIFPKEKLAHVYLGFHYYWQHQDFKKAIGCFNKALALDHHYGIAMNQLAYIYADRSEFEKAIEYFTRYASVSPGDANPFDSMGEIYFRMGSLDEAIARFEQALAVKPDFSISLWKIAYIYALKEQYSEVLRRIDQFIDDAGSPGVRIEGMIWRGFYFYWLGREEESIEQFYSAQTLARNIESESWEAYIDKLLAWCCYESGDLEPGRTYWKEWLDYYLKYRPTISSFSEARNDFFLGLLEIKTGNLDDVPKRVQKIDTAIENIRSGLMNEWLTYRAYLLTGELLLARGMEERAIAHFKEMPQLTIPVMTSKNLITYLLPILSDGLARAYKQNGQIDLAIAEYEKLLMFDPTSDNRGLIYPVYYYRVALLYEQQEQYASAYERLNTFITLFASADEDLPELIDAKNRLAALDEKLKYSSAPEDNN